MKQKSLDKKKLRNSFKYAFNGIKLCIENEQNMLIHFIIAILVVIFGILFKLTKIEWIICILLIILVFAAELINTALESVCDLITDKENEYVKIAKDTAAGAVLLLSIGSAIIGLTIFIPKLLEVII